jgi:hypothetical protein
MSNPQPSESRPLTVVQNFWSGSSIKDFRPNVLPSGTPTAEEIKEVEEAITPAPKDESAPEVAPSLDSVDQTEPSGSVTPVQIENSPTTPETTPVAEEESGKGSEPSGGEFPLPQTTSPSPETSSPSSSSGTRKRSGKVAPPAPDLPPAPSAPTPMQ